MQAPRLIIPDTLEFGELLAGRKEIQIANRGAVTFVHRFGSALNANLHTFTALSSDGLWSCQGGVRFHEASAWPGGHCGCTITPCDSMALAMKQDVAFNLLVDLNPCSF
jgi:hypothetical protein